MLGQVAKERIVQGHDPCDDYSKAAKAFAPAIARLSLAYEADRERARDLEQDIHVALWRSFGRFRGECALSTWVYRVAHNVAASHVGRGRRNARLVPIEAAENVAAEDDLENSIGEARAVAKLQALIRQLAPADRQIILLFLEGLDARSIAEVSGLTVGHVSVKIHRIKTLLARHFEEKVSG
jgi:RNA polymerase sigma-70 factor (ECF subfamily)